MSVLKTTELSKQYKQGDSIINAVDNVSVEIQKGEFVAIVGTSGCGKTTLLKLLGGIEKPTSGKVLLENLDIFKLKSNELAEIRRRKIGYIFQDYNLIPILTAQENIVLPTLLDKRVPDKEYFNELVELLSISNRIHHLPKELSGGQQQRVAVIRALINHPSIILADEPTGNLDKQSANDLINLMLKINEIGNTIIMVTHDMNVTAYADKVYVMDNGKIIEQH